MASRGWAVVGEVQWRELRAALPDVAEAAVREAGIAIAPPWGGVRQHSLDHLEASLGEFSAVYGARADLRSYCREQVIAAKDHARLASRNQRVDAARRALKAEMVEWMLVWLDDPAMFGGWVQIRRDRIGDCSNT